MRSLRPWDEVLALDDLEGDGDHHDLPVLLEAAGRSPQGVLSARGGQSDGSERRGADAEYVRGDCADAGARIRARVGKV